MSLLIACLEVMPVTFFEISCINKMPITDEFLNLPVINLPKISKSRFLFQAEAIMLENSYSFCNLTFDLKTRIRSAQIDINKTGANCLPYCSCCTHKFRGSFILLDSNLQKRVNIEFYLIRERVNDLWSELCSALTVKNPNSNVQPCIWLSILSKIYVNSKPISYSYS